MSSSDDIDAPLPEDSGDASAPNRSDTLQEPEQEAKRLFEVALDLLCVANPDGYFLQVNPAFEHVLGYTESEFLSRPIVDFVHPDDRERTLAALEQLGQQQNVTGFTNRYVCKDGSIVWLEWQARAYSDGERIYASARNITDLKRARLERDRAEVKFQEAQKLESVALLAGGIAHDFNNLLTTILGNTGLILMELDQTEPLNDRAESIQRAASTAADLCEQLLAYAGKGQFDVRPADLSAVVRETDHLVNASVSTSATVNYDLDADLPASELDATQIRQILMNVVKNASESLEDGIGTLHIETGVEDCRRSDLAETFVDDDLEEGEYVYLDIADTGCGMSPGELRRIFDPFYTTKFAGRGLGLAATLGIVRAHNGTVQVESTPGEGTSFRFYFPAMETNQPFSGDDRTEPFPALEADMILVADDQPDIRDFVEETLTGQNVAVLKAVDGDDAVEAFRHHHEELSAVMLDVMMPATDSREVLHLLQTIDPTTPIILSSGYSEQSSLEDDIEGIAGFLQKPYGPEDLLRTLDTVIRG